MARGRFVTGLLAAGCFASAVFLHAPATRANPADTFGLGSRSTAMGGAVAGRVTDYSANYYNPSALALSDSTQLTLGYVHVDPALSFDERAENLPSLDAWQLGLVVPGKLLETPIAFGLAAQVTGDRLARIQTFTESDQRWFLYDSRPEQLYLAGNLAARLSPWLAVGAGFAFVSSTQGTLYVTGTAVYGSQYDSQLEHEVEANLVSTRQPLLSATVSPNETFDVALVYRGQGSIDLDVNSNIRGNIDWATIPIPIEYVLASQTVASFLPQQATLGLRYGVLPTLDAHLDVSWVDWSAAPSPVNAIHGSLELDEPPGVFFELAEPPNRSQRSANLSDRLVPRLGLEWRSPPKRPVTWALRAGYAFEASPVVDESVVNLVDSDRHLLSVGAGLGLLQFGSSERGALHWDAHLQLGLLSDRVVPTAGGGSESVGGHFIAAGTTLGLHL